MAIRVGELEVEASSMVEGWQQRKLWSSRRTTQFLRAWTIGVLGFRCIVSLGGEKEAWTMFYDAEGNDLLSNGPERSG